MKPKNLGVVATLAVAIALLLILQMTTPATIGPAGILVVFILMYLLALSVLTFLLLAVNRIVTKVSNSGDKQVRQRDQLSVTQSYYYSSVMALAPVMLIGMQSVGGINVYGLILVVVFVVIACVYISKRSR